MAAIGRSDFRGITYRTLVKLSEAKYVYDWDRVSWLAMYVHNTGWVKKARDQEECSPIKRRNRPRSNVLVIKPSNIHVLRQIFVGTTTHPI